MTRMFFDQKQAHKNFNPSIITFTKYSLLLFNFGYFSYFYLLFSLLNPIKDSINNSGWFKLNFNKKKL